MAATVGAVQAIESNLVKIKTLSCISAGLCVAAKISSYIPFLNPISPAIQFVGTAGICGSTLLNKSIVTHLVHVNAADDQTMVQKTSTAISEMTLPIFVSVVCSGLNSVYFPWLFGAAVVSYLSHESLINNFLLARQQHPH